MTQPRVPSPVSGIDVLSLPLSTTEGFVLSRVDGTSSVEDISIMSGIAPQDLLSILHRLHELGAVELSWRPPPKKPAAAKAAKRGRVRAPFADPPPAFDERELDAPVDISVDMRRTILEAYYALEGQTHYELLGVDTKADKKTIRTSYFELSKVFHPDSQFGKELGSFKSKMEEVFKTLTEAYEVLGKKRKRAEYDEYLAATASARETTNSLRQSQQAMSAVRVDSPGSSAGAGPTEAAPPPGTRRKLRRSVRPGEVSPSERRARVRNRIRNRLRQVTGKPPQSSLPPSSRSPAAGDAPRESRASVIEGLKRSLHSSGEVSGGGTPNQRLQRHLMEARAAEDAGDYLRASHELQMALSIEPSNGKVVAEYGRVSAVVQRGLADNYEKQARYEEKQGKWKAAASSWMRVSDGRPEDGAAARAAAENLLRADGDLHLAQKYAQKAVKLAARDVARLTLLARVYLAAGLKLNAIRELEKAAKLDPEDEMVNNLLREARV